MFHKYPNKKESSSLSGDPNGNGKEGTPQVDAETNFHIFSCCVLGEMQRGINCLVKSIFQ